MSNYLNAHLFITASASPVHVVSVSVVSANVCIFFCRGCQKFAICQNLHSINYALVKSNTVMSLYGKKDESITISHSLLWCNPFSLCSIRLCSLVLVILIGSDVCVHVCVCVRLLTASFRISRFSR